MDKSKDENNKVLDEGIQNTAAKSSVAFIMPETPDPYWPTGAIPEHLTEKQRAEESIADSFKQAGVNLLWRCSRCNTPVNRSIIDPTVCTDCYDKLAGSSKLAKKTNENWMEQAEQLGLTLFERQPEENDTEWLIWDKYRQHYPLKLPTWNQLAKECGVAVGTVTSTVAKWNFRTRLIAWARYTDGDIQERRVLAVREMNERQLKMSKTIQEKLGEAIDHIDPDLLRPGEIVNLFKISTELERRIRTTAEEQIQSTAVDTQTQSTQKTKMEDLQEVLGILQSAGVLGSTPAGKVVGVEQKTTVIIKDGEQ